jgi:hypothetical protein
MKFVKQLAPVVLGLGAVIAINGGVAGAAKPKDVCLVAPTGGGGFNTFILREVEALVPGGAVALHGFYFTTGVRKIGPLEGTAAMGSDEQIRIGFFVHSTAEGGPNPNDFTISGLIDAGYNGTVGYDNDGDFKNNGTLEMQRVDCSTIDTP